MQCKNCGYDLNKREPGECSCCPPCWNKICPDCYSKLSDRPEACWDEERQHFNCFVDREGYPEECPKANDNYTNYII